MVHVTSWLISLQPNIRLNITTSIVLLPAQFTPCDFVATQLIIIMHFVAVRPVRLNDYHSFIRSPAYCKDPSLKPNNQIFTKFVNISRIICPNFHEIYQLFTKFDKNFGRSCGRDPPRGRTLVLSPPVLLTMVSEGLGLRSSYNDIEVLWRYFVVGLTA